MRELPKVVQPGSGESRLGPLTQSQVLQPESLLPLEGTVAPRMEQCSKRGLLKPSLHTATQHGQQATERTHVPSTCFFCPVTFSLTAGSARPYLTL